MCDPKTRNNPKLSEAIDHVKTNLSQGYTGLMGRFSKKQNQQQCKKEPATKRKNGNYLSTEDCDEKKIENLEKLIEDTVKRIEIEDEIREILMEQDNLKQEQKKLWNQQRKITHPIKCESIYDWTYGQIYQPEDISSPSELSLASNYSYYSLVKGRKTHFKKNTYLSDDEEKYHPGKGTKLLNTFQPPTKMEKLKAKVKRLYQEFKVWNEKRKEQCIITQRAICEREETLCDRIMGGFEPDLEDRADLESLYRKIRPKSIKASGTHKSHLEVKCGSNFDCKEELAVNYVPPDTTYRQREVLENFAKPNQNEDTIDEKREAIKMVLARKSQDYYGTGPTLWSCKRIDDTWFTTGEPLTMEPDYANCPVKKIEEKEIVEQKEFPSFFMLTTEEISILQKSWKLRGITKMTLAMLWVQALIEINIEKIRKELPELEVELIFDKQENVDYLKQIANIFHSCVKNLRFPQLCNKLIWETGLIHSMLGIEFSNFEQIKCSILYCFQSNFTPKLTEHQIAIWTKFIEIFLNLIKKSFLWNLSPEKDDGEENCDVNFLDDTNLLLHLKDKYDISDTSMSTDHMFDVITEKKSEQKLDLSNVDERIRRMCQQLKMSVTKIDEEKSKNLSQTKFSEELRRENGGSVGSVKSTVSSR